MSTTTRTTPRRFRGDEGAVVIEAALALPVLALFAVGMLEFGMAFHEGLMVDRGMALVGRVVSNQGSAPLADFETLRAVDSTMQSLTESSEIRRVIIYKSTTANGAVPAACLAIDPAPTSLSAAGVSGVCNVYSKAMVEQDTPGTRYAVTGTPPSACGGSSWHQFLCPVQLTHRNPKTQTKLGVYIEINYQPITGILPDDFTIERHVVFTIEPPSVGS